MTVLLKPARIGGAINRRAADGEFWKGLVAAWVPFLANAGDRTFHDGSPYLRAMHSTAGSGTRMRVRPHGQAMLPVEAANLWALPARRPLFQEHQTGFIVVERLKGTAFNANGWPVFRHQNFFRDDATTVVFRVGTTTGAAAEADKLQLHVWGGAAYTTTTTTAKVLGGRPYAIAYRIDNTRQTHTILIDGVQAAQSTGVNCSLSSFPTNLFFHSISGTGEFAPHAIYCHYWWNEAKSDELLERLSEDYTWPFRRSKRRRRAVFAAAGNTFTATAALAIGAATLSGSATHSPPVYTGAASLDAPAALLAGSAQHAPPTFTAQAALPAPAALLSGEAQHAAAIFQATAALQTGPTQLAASGTFTPPTYQASAALAAPAALLAASGTFTPPVFTATANLTAPAALLVAFDVTPQPKFPGGGTFARAGPLGVFERSLIVGVFERSGMTGSFERDGNNP